MATLGRVRCPQCGALLRRDRPAGARCDPCERVGSEPHGTLPADFYDQGPIVAMLAAYDFGPFLRQVRRLTRWSQQTLGGVIGLEQSQISAIERGESRLRNVEHVAGLARALAIPPARLNFPDIRATVGEQADAGRKDVSWVDRRDFGQHVAALLLGAAGAAGLDLNRLAALLPQAAPTGTRHLGAGDVAALEDATTALRQLHQVYGGGVSQAAAVAQLRSTLPLLEAAGPAEVRARLLVAAGHLAMEAGWMSHDIHQHDAARRLWLMGLELARETTDPRGADLTVAILLDLAAQDLGLHRPKQARHLVQIARTTAKNHRYPISAPTISFLAQNLARTHAALGDTAACERALGEMQERFGVADPADRIPWAPAQYAAALPGWQGCTHYELALTSRDPRTARQAVVSLQRVVDTLPTGHNRTLAFNLTRLAGANALAGDADAAVTVGHQAADAVSALSSRRAHDHIRTLHTVLEPMHTNPGVTELRDRLTTLAA